MVIASFKNLLPPIHGECSLQLCLCVNKFNTPVTKN